MAIFVIGNHCPLCSLPVRVHYHCTLTAHGLRPLACTSRRFGSTLTLRSGYWGTDDSNHPRSRRGDQAADASAPIDLVEQCFASHRPLGAARSRLGLRRSRGRAAPRRNGSPRSWRRANLAARCTASPSASRTSTTSSIGRPRAARSCGRTASPARMRRSSPRCGPAGAIFLGKTVTTQYASFDPPVTRNPWNLAHTPGGSAAARRRRSPCGMCLGALGSQTGGSITRPASYCGVAGFKPTYGLLAAGRHRAAGAFDGSSGADGAECDGSGVAAAGDGRLPTALIRRQLRREGGRRMPVGHALVALRQLFEEQADAAVRDMMDEICHRFSQDGAELEEIALPAGFSDVLARHRIGDGGRGGAISRSTAAAPSRRLFAVHHPTSRRRT